MAVTVTHAFVSALADDAGDAAAGKVVPSNWNASHTVTNALDKTGDTMTGQMTVAQGSITTSAPFTWTQTWNSGAVTFTALKVDVTNTASASSSLLADFQVGGASKFAISKDGKTVVDAGSNETVATFTNSYGQPWSIAVGNGNQFASGWMAIGIGTSVSASTYMVKFDPTYHVGTFRYAIASPSFNSDITGRGDSQVMLWTNTGGNFNGTLTVGQDYTSGTSNVEIVVGPSTGAFTVRNNSSTVFFTVDSATGAASALYVGTTAVTVSALPAAASGNKGWRAFVTDATATTFLSTVAGGGSNNVPVVSDGTNWLIG